jgi:hypothetical protein
MSPQEKHPSIFASVLEWCHNRMAASSSLPSEPSLRDAAERAAPACAACEVPERAGYFFNGGLLFRCMDMLAIDRNELAKDDPLLFRELQGRCALCLSREECVRELAHEFDDARWDKWREYCPNSPMLTTIAAVQNCALAAQHLEMPRSTASSGRMEVANVLRRGR